MLGIIDYASLIAIGYSLVSACILLVIYFIYIDSLNKSHIALFSCFFLTAGLCGLQIGHLQYILNEFEALNNFFYRLCILTVPPSFYFFSREILFPDLKITPTLLLNLLPVLLIFSSDNNNVVILISFALGTIYCLWLCFILFKVRKLRKRFKEEFLFFSLFSIMALLILAVGIFVAYTHTEWFYWIYANSIALAYILVVFMLLAKPNVVLELNEALALGYLQSTLLKIDIQEKLNSLNNLMEEEKVYQDENLNLSHLAKRLNLSSHQLSELINTHFGKNYSRYIRDIRIEEAQKLLVNEPEASVLSISMQVGFRSQSNFYSAFKEVCGVSPAQFRSNPN